MKPQSKPILIFLLFVFGISTIFYVMIARQGSTQTAGGLFSLLLMWSPAAAAYLTRVVCKIKTPGIGWRPGPAKYWLMGYLLPVAYSIAAYGLIWITGIAPFKNAFNTQMAGYMVVGSLFGVLSSLGEEIGWRGFLVPQLAGRFSFTATALISGAIWAVWHFPILLTTDYNRGGLGVYSLVMFTLLVLTISFQYTWLRLKSNSIWPVALLHASHNVFVLHVFDQLTAQTPLTPYFYSETGAGLVIINLLFLLIFWWMSRRSTELQLNPAPVG